MAVCGACVQVILALLDGPKYQSSDARSSDVAESISLPLSEKVRILKLVRKEEKPSDVAATCNKLCRAHVHTEHVVTILLLDHYSLPLTSY